MHEPGLARAQQEEPPCHPMMRVSLPAAIQSWPERGRKCRPVILSAAKDLAAHGTRPFAALRMTEGHPLPAVSNPSGEPKKVVIRSYAAEGSFCKTPKIFPSVSLP